MSGQPLRPLKMKVFSRDDLQKLPGAFLLWSALVSLPLKAVHKSDCQCLFQSQTPKTPTRYLASGTKLAWAAGSFFSVGALGGESPTAVRTPAPIESRRARPAILPLSRAPSARPNAAPSPRYLPAAPHRPHRATPPAGSSRPAPPPAASRRPGSAARLGRAQSSAVGAVGALGVPGHGGESFGGCRAAAGRRILLLRLLLRLRNSVRGGRARRRGGGGGGSRRGTGEPWRAGGRGRYFAGGARWGGAGVSGWARRETAWNGTGRLRAPVPHSAASAAAPASSGCGAAASGLAALYVFIFHCIYICGGGVCCLRRSCWC